MPVPVTPAACQWVAISTAVASGKTPALLIRAIGDPDGANLDRVQVIKGWLDAAGKPQEKVYDVAWSGNRKTGCQGQIACGGQHRQRRRSHLRQFDWFARATGVLERSGLRSETTRLLLRPFLEIPTPRWTAYDAKFFKVKLPADVPASIQERAYTSPIWYTVRSGE